MTVEKNAEFSSLLNTILICVKKIEEEYEDDIAPNALRAFKDLHDDVVTIMDWNGSKLTKEFKIHDVGFYFIGENDGLSKESILADEVGKMVSSLFDSYIILIKSIIKGKN